ncbi:MAG: hypothetical protein QNK36_16615 [Colwellia sp.]|nr:hypothetical protein [Colwellia sp.]
MPEPLKKQTFLSKIKIKLLCAFCGYFDGTTNKFYLDEHQQLSLRKTVEGEKQPLLMIIARQYYHEMAKTYPVSNKAELTKLLKLEFTNNPATKHYIWQNKTLKTTGEQTSVNIWQFSLELPHFSIQLPESLLFSLGGNQERVVCVESKQMAENNEQLFVAQKQSLIHSALSNKLINNSQRFLMSSGISANLPVHNVSTGTFGAELAMGFTGKLAPLIPHFIMKNKNTNQLKQLKIASVTFISVFFVYLLISSAYLMSKNYYLQQELNQQVDVVNTALDEQKSFDNYVQRYRTLQTFLKGQGNSTPFWLIMTSLFEDAQFSNFRMTNGRYVLRGTAPKATDLLVKLSKFSIVSDAKFDFPTRNIKGLDRFVIGFTIDGELNATDKIALQQILPVEDVITSEGEK